MNTKLTAVKSGSRLEGLGVTGCGMTNSTTQPPLTIRTARPADAETMTRVTMLSKQANGYDDAFMAMCADELRVTPERLEHGRYWVAGRGEILGCASLWKADENIGEVHAFFIHPDAQGQGVGRALWQVLLAAAKADGITSLRLDSDPEAEGFYKRLGFKTTGRSPSGSIPGRTIPLMELHLDSRD
ncbi:acetyltransferase [Ahrensia sp. R2A130]|nr:acetyltransferase [Ahrensia sp. R2A130]